MRVCFVLLIDTVPEGRSREECIEIKKEREQELRLMMKRLEAKYAALQVVPVISKLGTQRVLTRCNSCIGVHQVQRPRVSKPRFLL